MTNKEAKWELEHIYGMVAPDVQRALDVALKAIEKRPIGKWLVDIIGQKGDKTTIMRFKCSNCGNIISWLPGEKYPSKELFLNAHPWCFCGADMREERKNETEKDC